MKATFIGPAWRAQMRVLDVPGFPPLFTVYVLQSHRRAPVSFTGSGRRAYHGEDAARALSVLVHHVPDAVRQMPRTMRPFFRLPV